MFDHRSAAALQREKQDRFSKEAERDQARETGAPRLGLADRLLDAVGRRLVTVGKTLIYDERSGGQATVAHGPARMVALLAALALSIALAASGSTTEGPEPVSPAVVEQSVESLPIDQTEAPDETEQQLGGGPAGPLTSE